MNLKTLFINSTFIAGAAAALVSCDEPKAENRLISPNLPAVAVLTSESDGAVTLDGSVKYSVETETVDGVANLSLSGVDIPGRGEVTFATGDVKCTVAKDGGMTMRVNDLNTPAGVVTDMASLIYPRVLNGASGGSVPYVNTSFKVDGYKVRIVDNSCRWIGRSDVRTEGVADIYKTYEPTYCVKFNPDKGTADLYVYSARFDVGMPQAFDMVFPGIPFTISDTGYSLGISSVVPKIGEKLYERFIITDLTVTGNLVSNRLTVSFTCAGKYRVDATLGPLPVAEDK